jgi:hypothetical protein
VSRRTWVLRNERVLENALDAVISASKESGRLYRVILEPYKKPRTLQQNSTIHMWMNEIAEFVGDTPESVKRWLKDDFWPKHTVMRLGRMRTEPKSTADLTREEMISVMDRIQALCANFEIPITQPDPEIYRRGD